MIVVDTSALMAIVLNEPKADDCARALETSDRLLMSAGTFSESLIVAGRRNLAAELSQIVEGLGIEIVSLTPASAHRVAAAYACWGKGLHPANLNFGDCFAYELAASRDCPLLFVGDDFRKTDLRSVL